MPRIAVPARRTLALSLCSVLLLAAAAAAAAQGNDSPGGRWEHLPFVLAANSTVVVTMHDGTTVEGRVRRLSAAAIVIEAGVERSIAAADVESILAKRPPHAIRTGVMRGAIAGAAIASLLVAATAGDQCHCKTEDSLTWPDAAMGSAFFVGTGAGLGALGGAWRKGEVVYTRYASRFTPTELGGPAMRVRSPQIVAFDLLPGLLDPGSEVVVTTRGGRSVTGRLGALSTREISITGSGVETIAADEVATVKGARGKRPVAWGMGIGAFAGFAVWVGVYEAIPPNECHGQPGSRVTGDEALAAFPLLLAVGAGVGAGVGAIMPGRRPLIYSWAGRTPVAVSVAPLVGRGTRGAAVRVTF